MEVLCLNEQGSGRVQKRCGRRDGLEIYTIVMEMTACTHKRMLARQSMERAVFVRGREQVTAHEQSIVHDWERATKRLSVVHVDHTRKVSANDLDCRSIQWGPQGATHTFGDADEVHLRD